MIIDCLAEFSCDDIANENFIECSGLGTWDWLIQSGEVSVNRRWAAIIGYTLAELEPISIATWEKLVHPDDLIQVHVLWEAHFRQASDYYQCESRMKHKDGYWIWILDRGKVIEWDTSGTPVRMLGIRADLTAIKEIRETERFFNVSIDMHCISHIDGRIIKINTAWTETLGFSLQEMKDRNYLEYVHPDDRQLTFNGFELLRQEKSLTNVVNRFLCKDGSWRFLQWKIQVLDDRIYASARDITSLREEESKYRLIAKNTADFIWVYNTHQNRYTFVSPNISSLLGYSIEESLQLGFDDALTPSYREKLMNELPGAINRFCQNPDTPINEIRETQQVRKDGTIVWVEVSISIRYNALREIELVGVSRDINERKRKQAEIEYLSLHDPMTGLLNRHALRRQYDLTKADTQPVGHRAVLFANIDNFRVVNDALGHRAGDEVLIKIVAKLKACLTSGVSLYRYGGDEFVIILANKDAEETGDFARKILKRLSFPIHLDRQIFYLTSSIGICIGGGLETTEQLVKNADTALYIAKRDKNKIVFYSPEMEQTRSREMILANDLALGIVNGDFEIHYQPIYDVRNGLINQAEALLRWNHPNLGRISPAEFIPIAEKSKLIVPLTEWIIDVVCHQVAAWDSIGISQIQVSINISIISIENRDNELCQTIAAALQKTGIDPAKIKLEVTESVFMRDAEEITKAFNDIKNVGVRMVLDDFGAGYSAFSSIKNLPLDVIKLDRSLITNIVSDERTRLIIESMVALIHRLNLEVVVEGVETEEQLKICRDFNCDHVQGYIFSKPLPADDFVRYYFATQEKSPARQAIFNTRLRG